MDAMILIIHDPLDVKYKFPIRGVQQYYDQKQNIYHNLESILQFYH